MLTPPRPLPVRVLTIGSWRSGVYFTLQQGFCLDSEVFADVDYLGRQPIGDLLSRVCQGSSFFYDAYVVFCFPLPAAYRAYIFLKTLKGAVQQLKTHRCAPPSLGESFFITRMLRPSM